MTLVRSKDYASDSIHQLWLLKKKKIEQNGKQNLKASYIVSIISVMVIAVYFGRNYGYQGEILERRMRTQ